MTGHIASVNILTAMNFPFGYFRIPCSASFSVLIRGNNPLKFPIVYFSFSLCIVSLLSSEEIKVNAMAKSSEDVIVLSDDDEVKIESVITPKRTRATNSSRPSATSTTSAKRRAPILVLTEPKSISYGIERGYKLKHIHGVKRLPANNELVYLIEYDRCDDYEFVPATVLCQYCNENVLVDYLERLTQFTD